MKTTKFNNEATERSAIPRNHHSRLVGRIAAAVLGLCLTVGTTQHASAQTVMTFGGLDYYWHLLKTIFTVSSSPLQVSKLEASGQGGAGFGLDDRSHNAVQQPILLVKNFTRLPASAGVSHPHSGTFEAGLKLESTGLPLRVAEVPQQELAARIFDQVATDQGCPRAICTGTCRSG